MKDAAVSNLSFFSKGLDKTLRAVKKHADDELKRLKAQMTEAVEVVYRTATRPRHMLGGKSSANAVLGVPVRTGNLRKSIKKEVVKSGPGEYTGRVWVDNDMAPYGKFVEYGTSKMQARPFMRPALDLNRDRLRKIFSK